MDWQDTIAAPATSQGDGCRSILRVSGPEAFQVVRRLLHATTPLSPPCHPSAQPVLVRVTQDRSIDAMLFTWPSGRSYTGQETAEIHLPFAGPPASALLSGLFEAGARLARPGEFTLRAFLSGRLDLAQAEGVLGVIQAEDPEQLRRAIDQRTGGWSAQVHHAHEELLDLLADLEAGLDFVEEDISFITNDELATRLDHIGHRLSKLVEETSSRQFEHHFPQVVFMGPPNAGKSSLFNALVGESRALVSPIPGATRDSVTAVIHLGATDVELIDTAGALDDEGPKDRISSLAAEQRRHRVQAADLVIQCIPTLTPSGRTRAIQGDDPVESAPSRRTEILKVRTKIDLDPGFSDDRADCHVSALEGTGLFELRVAIQQRLARRAGLGASSFLERCHAAVKSAIAAIESSRASANEGASPELAALSIREALAALGDLVGPLQDDDFLDRLFSRFCIGK